MRLQKRLNIALTVALTIAFILLGIFTFRQSYCRTIEALIDLYGSFKYYFCVLFGFPVDGIPSVAERSKVLNWDVILPADFETFKANCIAFFRLFISKENFLSWLNSTGGKAGVWAKIFIILLPCILAVIIAIKRLYAKGNKKAQRRHSSATGIQENICRNVSTDKAFYIQLYRIFTRA